MMHYELILLAAGQGKRMQASKNKILLSLLGRPVIAYAIDVFLADPACQHIILVIQKDEKELIEHLIKKYFKRAKTKISIVVGGKERQDSVYNGLLAIDKKESFVFVHDGARPFVTRTLLKQLYRTVSEKKAAILGVPVKDTIKKIVDGKVEQTVPREYLWQIQTPQAFVAEELQYVHECAYQDHYIGTDDASLMEKYGNRTIEIVLGSYENIKLTTPDDMIIGEAIAKQRKSNLGGIK